MDDVDRAFVEHLGTAAPRMAQVAKFFEDARCAGVVHEYAALAAYVRGFLILLRHIFLREFRGKLRAHTGHRGSRAWAIRVNHSAVEGRDRVGDVTLRPQRRRTRHR